jgi:NADH:ubiquinone oxidoreductase subunit F (NADH-binding)
MLEVFERIVHGQGEMSDIGTLEKASTFIRDASLCGLGQTAPNPVITTLRYFKDEYIQHILNKTCEAGKCFKTRDEEQLQ